MSELISQTGACFLRAVGLRHDAAWAGLDLVHLRPLGIARQAFDKGFDVRCDVFLVAAAGAMHEQGRQKAHAAQGGRLLIRRQEGVEEIAVVALRVVARLRPAGAGHQPEVLALQRDSARPVRPVVGQHFVEPQFLQRRHRIPLNRVHQHQKVRPRQPLLLGRHINGEVGVGGIQVVHIDVRHFACGSQQAAVDARVSPVWMGGQQVDAGSGVDVGGTWHGREHSATGRTTCWRVVGVALDVTCNI